MPPWSSTRFFVIAIPSPMPPDLLLSCRNGHGRLLEYTNKSKPGFRAWPFPPTDAVPDIPPHALCISLVAGGGFSLSPFCDPRRARSEMYFPVCLGGLHKRPCLYSCANYRFEFEP